MDDSAESGAPGSSRRAARRRRLIAVGGALVVVAVAALVVVGMRPSPEGLAGTAKSKRSTSPSPSSVPRPMPTTSAQAADITSITVQPSVVQTASADLQVLWPAVQDTPYSVKMVSSGGARLTHQVTPTSTGTATDTYPGLASGFTYTFTVCRVADNVCSPTVSFTV